MRYVSTLKDHWKIITKDEVNVTLASLLLHIKDQKLLRLDTIKGRDFLDTF